ncbi:VOC family protein [Neobacillus niacini]|uniref:VOC family protein n=1 Tax=Neobacillus niacini TaxID=86668 RepID=UPI002FFFBE98
MKKFEYLPEIAKLGHVAVISADLEKSLWFFKDVVGLEETAVADGVHYLRAWGDFEHHSLTLQAGEESRVDHIAFKTKRREDVNNFAILLEDAGIDVTKVQAGTEKGQGEAIRFNIPAGHSFELYFDMEKPLVEKYRKSVLKNQPLKPWNKGVSPRRIDHVNTVTTNAGEMVKFLKDILGFNIREYIKAPNDQIVAAWMSVTSLVHDIAVMTHPTDQHGLHHLAYWSENAQDMLRAADILSENGLKFVGPGKHGITQAMYIYVQDPGSGVLLELFANGYQIFEPDWEPIEWTVEDMQLGVTYWGQETGKTEAEQRSTNAGFTKSKTY